jgi:hypothetical protein
MILAIVGWNLEYKILHFVKHFNYIYIFSASLKKSGKIFFSQYILKFKEFPGKWHP